MFTRADTVKGTLAMRSWKISLATGVLAICGAYGASSVSAQFGAHYGGSYPTPVYNAPVYRVPVYGPTIAPPIVVARPVVVAPAPVVTAYRPVVPTYLAPVASYSTYRPVYPAATVPVATVPVATVPIATVPVYAPPAYGTVARYRSGYLGPGLGGVPSVYTPGQPVRNAIRYVVP